MDNKRYHVVDRNNYFLGKLMTVRDFFTEQDYFNSRRYLGNKFTFGSGIVAGLNIFLVDNKTFSLEPGIAFDFYGREIVVSQNCVRKIHLVNGFEKVKSKTIIYLCIKYKENLDESTFSIANSGTAEGEKQFNRIKEGYELFLTDKCPDEFDLRLDGVMFRRVSIYEENGIRLWGKFPKYANPGKKVKVQIFFEKESVDDLVSFDFTISGILFKKGTDVLYEETNFSNYKSVVKTCFLDCDAKECTESELIISKHDFDIKIGSDHFTLEKDVISSISIKNEEMYDLMVSNYFSMNFDELIEENDDKYIYLAKMRLIVDGANYFVEEFSKIPAKQYVLNNDLLRLSQTLEEENIEIQSKSVNSKKIDNNSENKDSDDEPIEHEKLIEKDNIVTGVETVNLGFKPKANSVYFSYEFVHGLGPGNVAVVTSILNEENPEFKERELLVFGDGSIFDTEDAGLSIPYVQTAAIVDPKKGTIRIGVRLSERTNVQHVKIRWWAMKPIENKRLSDDLIVDDSMKITITPDSAHVKPTEQVRFSAEISGTSDQRVKWILGKDNPGKIDANGLYTAPASEGIFEIIAQSVSFESIQSSSYVVVSYS